MKRCRFTLVELLMVIAIIAILAALLLPALRSAKETANQIHCSGNLKQIAVAIFAYSTDNSSCFPKHYDAAGTAGINRYWEDLTAPYCNAYYDSTRFPRYHGSIFDCSSFSYNGVDCAIGKYTYHLLYWSLYPDLQRAYSTDTKGIKNPSKAGIVADGGMDSGANTSAKIGVADESSALGRYLRNRHKKGLNILFCDGHVNWQRANINDNLGAVFSYNAN